MPRTRYTAVVAALTAGLLALMTASTGQTPALAGPPAAFGPVVEGFAEIAGEMEFSGRMIVRPLQPEVWEGQGLTARQTQARLGEARELLGEYDVLDYVQQTDEYIVQLPADTTENDLSQRLMATGLFQYAEPDWVVWPIGCPNDSRFGSQWHHDTNHLQSCAAWDIHTGDPTTSVGICDTGIRTTHQDFQLHRLEGYNAVDRLWESQGGQINDLHGHGTATTGCAAANGNNGVGVSGLGWNLSHRMLRVSNTSSGSSSITTLTHAARTSVEAGDRVASVSYSGVTSSSVATTGTYIKSINGLLFWAAGNSASNLNLNHRDDDDVLIIGATTISDSKSSFSSFGLMVDFMAPGSDVFTTNASSNSSYGSTSGTSFSCPLSAGLAALIFSSDPSLTPDEVELIMKESCDDLGAAGPDNTFGYGRINALNALTLSAINLSFDYPNGRPDLFGTTGTTIRVEVVADGAAPQPGTGMLHYNDGSGWISLPMNELTNNVYDASFPGFTCGETVSYYFSAETTDGQVVNDPGSAPGFATYSALVGTGTTVIFADDFQTNQGWTVQNVSLTSGAWERGVPVGGGGRGDPAVDFDGSGSCFVTENAAGDSDVDGGPTRLISPIFDASSGQPFVSYARWFYNDDSDADRLTVEISNNGGSSWTLVENVAGSNSASWIEHRFPIADFVTPTNQMRVRFSATDNPNDSVTEAGLDAFEVTTLECGASQPAVLTDVTTTLGFFVSGTIAQLIASDNTYYVTQSGPGLDQTEPHSATTRFTFDSGGFPASTLDITVEEKANIGGPTAVVLLNNQATSEWDEIGRRSLSPTDQTFQFVGIPASDYIGGQGNIRVEVRSFAVLVLDPTVRGIFSHDFVGVLMEE